MHEFTGFPEAAFDFYDDLEVDNTRSFWEAHKHLYETAVKAPMVALTEALSAEFGPPKIFRPYRDVRFAKDKTPYKDHQGAYVAIAPSTGWYVEIAAPGFRVSGGFFDASAESLARIRPSIDDPRTGPQLERLLRKLQKAGFTVGGERLKTSPRGYDVDHPRIELLRHKSLFVGKSYGFDKIVHSPELVDEVRKDWRTMRPLVEWAAARIVTP